MATESPGTLGYAEVSAQAGDSVSSHLAPFVKVKGIDLSLAGMIERSQVPCSHQEHRPAAQTMS